MAFEAVRSITLNVLSASADIAQGSCVIWDGTEGLSLPATAGESTEILGVTLELYDDSEADLDAASSVIPVALLDGAKIEVLSGAAITAGDTVIAGNDGRVVTTTTTAGGTTPAGDYQEIGIALTASGGAGEFITMASFRGQIVTTV